MVTEGPATAPTPPRLPAFVLPLSVLAAVFGVAALLHFGIQKPGDIALHLQAGRRMLEGESIYRPESPAWPYPPFLALLQTPLVPLPEDAVRFAWNAVSTAFLAASLFLCRRLFRDIVPTPKARSRFGVLTLAVASIYLFTPLDSPGNDLLILALVMFGVDAWRKDDSALAGLWFGIGAACKATPLIFVLLFALRRRWTGLGVLLMTAAGLTLLPDLVFPQKNGEHWAESWYRIHLSALRPDRPADAPGAWHLWNPKNQNLTGPLYRIGTPIPPDEHVEGWVGVPLPPPVLRGVIVGAQAALGLLLLWMAWPRSSSDEPIARIAVAAALACGMLLLSPMTSKSHFGVLLLPIAVLSARIVVGAAHRAAWLTLAAVACLGWMTSRDAFGDRISEMAQAYGCYALAAILCLVAMIPAIRSGSQHEPLTK